MIETLASIEFADDKTVDPDFAVSLMEAASSELAACSSDEKFIISEAIRTKLEELEEENADPEVIAFFKNFEDNFSVGTDWP